MGYKCNRWCHEANVHHVKDSVCKCAACRDGDPHAYVYDYMAVQLILDGAPCTNGRVHNHTHAHKSEPSVASADSEPNERGHLKHASGA